MLDFRTGRCSLFAVCRTVSKRYILNPLNFSNPFNPSNPIPLFTNNNVPFLKTIILYHLCLLVQQAHQFVHIIRINKLDG